MDAECCPTGLAFPFSLCPSTIRESRRVFSWREQAQRLILRKEQTCLCFLSLSCVGGFAQVRFQETQSSNSPVFIHYWRGGEDLGRGGRDKAVQEMNQSKGATEALCDSAAIMKRGTTSTNSRGHSPLPIWTSCGPVSQSSLLSFHCSHAGFFLFRANKQ